MSSQNKISTKESAWNSFFKWIGISFVVFIISAVVLMCVIVWKFSPVFKIDKSGIELFGGTITIHNSEEDKRSNKDKSNQPPDSKFRRNNKPLENFI